jgi:UDP-3-O-[3-hydroxymyristoyl] glucosamine N-acyltransferase
MEIKKLITKYTGYDSFKNKIEHTGLMDAIYSNTVSFLSDPKFASKLAQNSNIVAILVNPEDAQKIDVEIEKIIIEKPKSIFFDIHNEFCKLNISRQVTKIDPDANIASSAYVSPYNVSIESGVIIHPQAAILDGVSIQKGTIIGPGTIIGTHGFHCYDDINGNKKKVYHDGKVIIGENVEIGSNVSIDKGLMGRDTIIGDHTKIDNLVHIAHRVHIGCSCLVAAGAIISGSVTTGNDIWIGPGATISNRITLGNNAQVLIGSVVVRNVKDNERVSGNFAMDHFKRMLRTRSNI